jgi:hypothetical protein
MYFESIRVLLHCLDLETNKQQFNKTVTGLKSVNFDNLYESLKVDYKS